MHCMLHNFYSISTNSVYKPTGIYKFLINLQPIDPFDAACSSLESAMEDCTAVTENALAMRFSTLKFHEKVSTYYLKRFFNLSSL